MRMKSYDASGKCLLLGVVVWPAERGPGRRYNKVFGDGWISFLFLSLE